MKRHINCKNCNAEMAVLPGEPVEYICPECGVTNKLEQIKARSVAGTRVSTVEVRGNIT